MKTELPYRKNSGKAKLALLAAVALAAAGASQNLHAQFSTPAIPAGEYAGGGFIASKAGGKEKATFGFNLEAVDKDGDGIIDRANATVYVDYGIPGLPPFPSLVDWYVGQGQFQYNDHGARVKFHLDHDASYVLNPDGSVPDKVTATSKFVGPPLWFTA
jgi:hypothetical protein